MQFLPSLGVLLSLLLSASVPTVPPSPASPASEEKKDTRFLERIRVLGVRELPAEITILDPEGKSRVWSKGDRVEEEDAVVEKITRSTLVLTRGGTGEDYESLIVVRFKASGEVKVREYSRVSDSPQPQTPPPESFD